MHPAAARYLSLRNITQSTASLFGLSYATSGRFKGRLLFPLHDHRGVEVGVAGRVLDDSLPKYINSAESEAYKKSSLLYNLHRAWPTIRRTGFVWIFEGYMDVITVVQSGVQNAVACCGTSLTAEHCRMIRKMGVRPILCLDNDSAGRKATARATDLLVSFGVQPLLAELGQAKDPDEFVRTTGHFLPDVKDMAAPRKVSTTALLAGIGVTIPSLREKIAAAGIRFDVDDFGAAVDRLIAIGQKNSAAMRNHSGA